MKFLVVLIVAVVAMVGCKSTSTEANGTLAPDASSISVIFAGTQSHGLFRTTDFGQTWTKPTGFPTQWVISMAAKNHSVFAIAEYNRLFGSIDDGHTWKSIIPNRSGLEAITLYDSMLVALADDRSLLSSNDGVTWVTTDSDFFSTFTPHSAVEWQGRVFCAGSRGLASSMDGRHWTLSIAMSNCFAIASNGSDLVLGSDTSGILCSVDNGSTWNRIDSNLIAPRPTTLGCDGNWILVGTTGGLFRTNDHGATWTQANFGQPNNNLYINSIACHGKYVLAATSSNGILLSADTGRSWKSISAKLADTTALFVGAK